MAVDPNTVTNEYRIDDGKRLGNTGQKAAAASVGGPAIGTLIAYLLARTGFETDADTAVLVAGAIVAVLTPIFTALGAKYAPTSGGVVREVLTHVEERTGEELGPVTDTGVPVAPTSGSSPLVAEDPQGGLGLEEMEDTDDQRYVGRHVAKSED